ncbi:MAG: stage II sporulation protein M, partial [Planctomycetaceae bacterium]
LVGTGHHSRFLSFVVSHGSFELVAIAVAGGAGLILGHALLHPGQRTRLESLWHRGAEAVQIAVGAGAMLLVAALIEAFWSPTDIPDAVKFVVGGLLWILVFVYLLTAGRWEKAR